MLFHCPEQGCCSEFTSSEELQDYVHLGEHSKREVPESLYDSLRHDWAMKFSSLTLESKIATLEVTGKVKSEVCKMGWALQKTRGSGTKFTEKVKEHLSSSFQTSERTGRKADPDLIQGKRLSIAFVYIVGPDSDTTDLVYATF